MHLYNFKLSLRNLWRYKGYSLITIMGLAFSLAIALLIFRYVYYELTYDRFEPGYKNTYRLYDVLNNRTGIDYTIGDEIAAKYPEVKAHTKIVFTPPSTEITYNINSASIKLGSTDSCFFKIFGYKLKRSLTKNPFENKESVVLTENLAGDLFGNGDPLGKEVWINHRQKRIVSAVMENPKTNSCNQFSALVCGDLTDNKFSMMCSEMKGPDDYSHCINPFEVYLSLDPACDKAALLKKINAKVWENKGLKSTIGMISLKDIYLYATTRGPWDKHGNAKLVYLFLALAIILIVIAIINYINLTIARSVVRAREVGISKIMGASRSKILIQSLVESVISAMIAMNLGLVIYEFLLPYYNAILHTSIDTLVFSNISNILLLLGLTIIIGLLGGLYPGLYLSSFHPSTIVKSMGLGTKRNLWFQRILIVFQFTVAIALIAFILILNKQLAYVKHADLGFNKELLINIDLPAGFNKNQILKDKLLANRAIETVSLTGGRPFDIHIGMGNDLKQMIQVISCDADFLKTFNIELLEGRDFKETETQEVLIVNQSFMKNQNWKNIEGKTFQGRDLIGVVKDFHFSSMHSPIEPLGIMFSANMWSSSMIVRMDGKNNQGALQFIKKTYNELAPDYSFHFKFFDDIVKEQYIDEESLSNVLVFFSMVALLVSCLGIFGLSSFFTERKTKEIGIRKVTGATTVNIAMLLSNHFITLVVISIAIATPLSWYISQKWLRSFAYKTELSWWIFAAAGLIAIIIALLTVSWQSWRAANKNPVEALRYVIKVSEL